MLRYGGVPDAKECGELADRALAVDQLTENQQPVAIGQGLEQLARGVGRRLHIFDLYFHTCVYTQVRIYVNHTGWPAGCQSTANGALISGQSR